MSTRFTKTTIMPESDALRLLFATSETRNRITEFTARKLKEKGYENVSSSMLSFLGTLDCGVNYGSEIARNLNVSRQMVAKTVKELCMIGYLKQVEGKGRQKNILFTASGEKLMSEARKVLAELDKELYRKIGEKPLLDSTHTLEEINKLLFTDFNK